MSRLRAVKLEHLTAMDLFRDLNERELEELDNLTTMSTVGKGKVFYYPDEMGEVLFLLKKGRVQLYRISPDGKKLILGTLEAGSVFGEMSLIGQRMYNTFAEALESCLICVMSRADLERLAMDKPKVAVRMLDTVGRRLMEAEARLEDMAFKTAPARLASLFVRYYDAYGELMEGVTHQELADNVGTYRETTTQILNDFKRRGLIDTGRKRIVLLDIEGLRAIAEA
jgi:CRP/FNR family transcriptional regulator, cyclic AMP receptor protein